MTIALLCAGCAADPETTTPDEDGPAVGAADRMVFRDACAPGRRVVVAAVGDILLHGPLQKQAYAHGHATLWQDVVPLLQAADLTYGNLEGPAARGVDEEGRDVPDPGPVFDGVVYTGFPRFNYHPSVVPALAAAGFDAVSTANNHALDRRTLGVDRTIDALVEGELPFTGTRRRGDAAGPWGTITEAAGVRVAWLACTFSTNDIPDEHHQVLACDDDRAVVLDTVRALAAAPDVDAVIVVPHGGDEYAHVPASRQVRLAREVLDAGAVAVLGNHPHVLQPWERIVAADGREGFVAYSIGNFVTMQRELPRRTSVVLYLGLTLGDDGVARVHGAGYVPTIMERTERYQLVPTETSRDEAAAESLALATTILPAGNRLTLSVVGDGAPDLAGCE